MIYNNGYKLVTILCYVEMETIQQGDGDYMKG